MSDSMSDIHYQSGPKEPILCGGTWVATSTARERVTCDRCLELLNNPPEDFDTLLPLKEDRKCPACGHDKTTMKHIVGPARLLVSCERCDFRWEMARKDRTPMIGARR